jgi:superfamily I DNA/RNA helicase
MGDWVRYKLDQATDHILVDEAQDTNERQWSIVSALTEEFFAGDSAVPRHRHHLYGRRFQAGHLPLPGHQSARVRRSAQLLFQAGA